LSNLGRLQIGRHIRDSGLKSSFLAPGLTALLVPAVQKVRDAANTTWSLLLLPNDGSPIPNDWQ
jgi:hypothetical protein